MRAGASRAREPALRKPREPVRDTGRVAGPSHRGGGGRNRYSWRCPAPTRRITARREPRLGPRADPRHPASPGEAAAPSPPPGGADGQARGSDASVSSGERRGTDEVHARTLGPLTAASRVLAAPCRAFASTHRRVNAGASSPRRRGEEAPAGTSSWIRHACGERECRATSPEADRPGTASSCDGGREEDRRAARVDRRRRPGADPVSPGGRGAALSPPAPRRGRPGPGACGP